MMVLTGRKKLILMGCSLDVRVLMNEIERKLTGRRQQ
jgi:hypothetical protein